jgi:RNase P subunit RPR2
MKGHDLLIYLNCKGCGRELVFGVFDEQSFESGEIDNTSMHCSKCGTMNRAATKADFLTRRLG